MYLHVQNEMTVMKTFFFSVILFLCTVFGFGQGFNPDASFIEFKASNVWVNTVKGTIQGWEGTVEFDEDNLNESSFDVRADLRTLDTGNEKRDKDLLSEDFLEVETYPTVRFRSLNVNELASGGYVVIGELTLKNVTQEVVMPFDHVDNQLIGEMTINRFNFNVGTDTGTFMVGKEIEIKVVCVLE